MIVYRPLFSLLSKRRLYLSNPKPLHPRLLIGKQTLLHWLSNTSPLIAPFLRHRTICSLYNSSPSSVHSTLIKLFLSSTQGLMLLLIFFCLLLVQLPLNSLNPLISATCNPHCFVLHSLSVCLSFSDYVSVFLCSTKKTPLHCLVALWD